jgi:hypothetical protein
VLIARRDLYLVQGDSTVVTVPVQIDAPHYGAKDWSCRCTIGWPQGEESHVSHGVDAVQALVLALQFTGHRIYMSDEHRTGRLFFDRPGNGYGFPVPKSCRDVLIGDDRNFEG